MRRYLDNARERWLRPTVLLVLCAVLASSWTTFEEIEDAETALRADSPLQWPIETGVTSFVTQSPASSGQPYPCGSGVNGRHILHDHNGTNEDYLESLDIVARSAQGTELSWEGRGTGIVAVASGRVVARNFSQNECERPFGAGNYIIVEHDKLQSEGKPLLSAYMHLNSYRDFEGKSDCEINPHPSLLEDFTPPAIGAYVRAGQKLAEMGNTGNSTGPHLHFQFAKHCTLEPADTVLCPAVSVLAVNQVGFDKIAVRRDTSCEQLAATGGPIAEAERSPLLPDGSYVVSQGAANPRVAKNN